MYKNSIYRNTVAFVAGILLLLSFNFACAQHHDKNSKQQVEVENKLFSGQIAPLLEGMGELHFPISTNDTLAQQFFDQAMMLSYGFNHKEAERSFRQVAKLDPENAMAWWGVALVQGPNINSAMMPEAVPVAWEALQNALKFKENASPREQAYIEALAKRYIKTPMEDRSSLDKAYAEAMGKLAKKYPDDLHAQVLYAEAMLDLHPWDYWKQNGEPQPWTPEILRVLESVLERNPYHAGANHFYIHALEASQTPEKALPSANRLRKLVPGAGHLVHMPAHIYIRTGDYHEGTLANLRAIASDDAYITQCRQQGIYAIAYMAHNHHFLWATATLEGRKKLATKAALATSMMVNTDIMRMPDMGTLQHYWIIPLYAYVRFGDWQKILSYPKPADDLIYPQGVWHYARGLAYTAQNEFDKAETELAELKTIAVKDTLNYITIWEINTTKQLMQIATRVLEGELAAAQGKYGKAIRFLNEAVRIEDALNYNEPADWFFPVRHNLGAVLLEAGQNRKAEKIYREDLETYPKNGWALFGLAQSLKAQGKETEAKKVKEQFEEAWKHADITLKASRFMK